MTRLRLENIRKAFGSVEALRDINLAVEPGEIFFLLGPSGCGKSTLLRIIAGLLAPSAGRVFFGDIDVTDLPTQKRNAVMCFQSYALWPHMTVRENVRFGLETRRIPRSQQNRRVEEILQLVQLDSLAGRKPNELSGGQQQRVALARALVVEPACLLLDEPLSNLDAALRLEMRGEIRRLCRQANLTAVYVTHDQKEALSIADRVAVMDAGRIAQAGPPRQLYLRPASRFVAGFMGETNFIEGTVRAAEGSSALIDTPVGGISSAVLPDGPLQAGARVTLSIRPEVLRLGVAPVGAPNVLPAMVFDTVYLGEAAQHWVRVGRGTTLKALELNPHLQVGSQREEKTSVWFDPADVVTLDG
jgi:iron(III) transport system ATP-binding protein